VQTLHFLCSLRRERTCNHCDESVHYSLGGTVVTSLSAVKSRSHTPETARAGSEQRQLARVQSSVGFAPAKDPTLWIVSWGLRWCTAVGLLGGVSVSSEILLLRSKSGVVWPLLSRSLCIRLCTIGVFAPSERLHPRNNPSPLL
jgi:hypothetical protein